MLAFKLKHFHCSLWVSNHFQNCQSCACVIYSFSMYVVHYAHLQTGIMLCYNFVSTKFYTDSSACSKCVWAGHAASGSGQHNYNYGSCIYSLCYILFVRRESSRGKRAYNIDTIPLSSLVLLYGGRLSILIDCLIRVFCQIVYFY